MIVDIYCRVSTDEQEDGTSLDEQESAGRAYCRERGLTVGMVHREIWTGYEYRERKKLTLMRERYREGKTEGVVIRTLDRLSRSQTHVAVLIEEMEFYNVELHGVKEVIDNTPMGKFARMVLAFVAEMEREKILDRTLTGRVNKALNGEVVSGTKALYGWQWIYRKEGEKMVRDHIELDEAQAAVLRRAAEEYAAGESLYTICDRFDKEGIASPKGARWQIRTLRRLLTDVRMTGKNVKIFTVKNKRAKQHLETVDLPDGTYPAILSDELYQKVLDRANTNAALSTRNSRTPERFLLRAGFVKCSYCGYMMTSKTTVNRKGTEYPLYTCPNPASDCNHYYVPSGRLDEAVWAIIVQLADHITLLEQSIDLAMKSYTHDDDLKAVEATIIEWQQKVANFENDLEDSRLRGDTRAGIRNMLDNANAVLEELHTNKSDLERHSVNRDREREEYEKILAWCKKVKEDREELTYIQKRDFLRMLGAVILVERLEKRGAPVRWDIKVRLPEVENVIYQGVNGNNWWTPTPL
jgi:site-specific DNA recombinase